MAKANYFAMEQSGVVSSGKIGPKCSLGKNNPKTGFPLSCALAGHFDSPLQVNSEPEIFN